MNGTDEPFTFTMSPDGLTLTMEYETKDVFLHGKTSWKTREEAEQNRHNTVDYFRENAEKIASHAEPGITNRIFHLWRGLYLIVTDGPPTWWLPRASVKIKKRMLRFGWLRRAYVLVWKCKMTRFEVIT